MPTSSKFKVYIVDEVHMLTTEAFNALLKTLEEPPEHVKFIFATTDPNKVPATIISRCQRFDFKRIALKTIVDLLNEVCIVEKFIIDEDALYAIGKAAQGSLRDALSILDQLSALSEQGIKAEDVFSMLGMVETELIFELADSLGQKNCCAALENLETITEKGKDIKQLIKDLIEHFRNLMVIKIGGKALGKLVDHPIAIKEKYLKQTQIFTLDEILIAIDSFIGAQDAARVTESCRIPLEIAFAKLTYGPDRENLKNDNAGETNDSRNSPKPLRFTSSVGVLKNRKGQVDISGKEEKLKESKFNAMLPSDEEGEGIEDIGRMGEVVESSQDEEVLIDPSDINVDRIKAKWDQLTYAVSREKMSTATYLQEGVPYQLKGDELIIAFSKDCSFHKETLEDQNNVLIVEKVLKAKLKTSLRCKYILLDTNITKEEEDHIKTAIETFKGEVVERWHND